MTDTLLEISKVIAVNNTLLYYLLEAQLGKEKAREIYNNTVKTINDTYNKELEKHLKKGNEK